MGLISNPWTSDYLHAETTLRLISMHIFLSPLLNPENLPNTRKTLSFVTFVREVFYYRLIQFFEIISLLFNYICRFKDIIIIE